MKGVQQVNLGTLGQVLQALEAVVCRCVGPRGGQVFFTKETGEVLVTRDGRQILTALQLDHPLARALVGHVSAHCAATGDGAKSFVLLLAALLRGIQAPGGPLGTTRCSPGHKSPHWHQEVRRTAHQLLSFQAQVLEAVMKQYVVPRATTLFLHRGPEVDWSGLRLLMQAFFQGRLGPLHCQLWAQMACDFYHRWRCERDRVGTLRLISDHFPELHTTVTGLPMGRSQVLQGLLFHRDFAVYCPTEGPLNAVVLNMALQPALAETGCTLIITSSVQLQGSASWLTCQVERTIASLQRLQVRLLLSGVKQSDVVLCHARRAGLSVVECLDSEALSLFCCLSGVLPLTDLGDLEMVGKNHVASVSFCQPLVLGSCRYAHVGIPEGRDFLPHCLVVCGPVQSLTDQCISAFRDAIRMMQHVCEPIRYQYWRTGEGESKNMDPSVEKSCSSQTETLAVISHDAIGTLKDSDKYPERNLTLCHRCITKRENSVHPLVETCCSPDPLSSINGQNSGKARAEGGHSASDVTASVKGNFSHSNDLIEPGSMLPVGGAFEFLLHHYLLKYSSGMCCPDGQAACRLVADALLSVPRRLYSTRGTNRRFLQIYTRFVSGMQNEDLAWPVIQDTKGLESVACKYMLLVSVLQCLGRLLSVDTIIYTSVLRITDQMSQGDTEDGHLNI